MKKIKGFKKILIVFYCVISILFIVLLIVRNKMMNDPISGAAMSYLWENESLIDEISDFAYDGQDIQITHIGKNIVEEIYKSADEIKIPFGVYIKEDRFLVYVTLVRNGNDWIAVSYELMK